MEAKSSKIDCIIEMCTGTRVEIDFIDILGHDEGVLVGDSAKGFVCVLAETRETETYPPRPFRVNAGAIHQYVYMGENKTKYLSELKAGDRVMVVGDGHERLVTVGRVKIESREFERVVLDSGISATLQKADSVFVHGKDTPLHLIDLKEGDIITCFPMQDFARHKGEVIEEAITEK